MHSPLRLLLIGSTPQVASFAARHCGPDSPASADLAATLADAEAMLCGDLPYDAIVLDAASVVVVAAAEVEAIAARAALVAVVVEPDAEHTLGWLRSGAEDVLGPDELLGPAGWRRVRFAVERRRRGEGREPAYATDPGTGLPHRRQLVEHLSQLLALRERDPSPMAVLALRVELPAATSGSGDEAELLRRKIAVRLRAGVRASDIVAAIDGEDFAVVLGTLLASADAARVAEKLGAAIAAPIRVGNSEHSVPVALGIAHYPQDGNQADRLLRRALALAAVAPALTHAGPAAIQDPAGALRTAANDEA